MSGQNTEGQCGPRAGAMGKAVSRCGAKCAAGRWLIAVAAAAVCFVSSGCQLMVRDSKVFDRYYMTTLKFSSSADVLAHIQKEDSEFLSQSESVVASWGQKWSDAALWFNMVAFDEDELTAVRKYAFLGNEKAKGFYIVPAQSLRFDAQIVIDRAVLDEPYANENERRIAVLQNVLDVFSEDVNQLTFDSQTLMSASMMAKRALNTILVKLSQSPALAVTLPDLTGLDFRYPNLGKGRARMIINQDIVKLKIKVGTSWFNRQRFHKHPDVQNM